MNLSNREANHSKTGSNKIADFSSEILVIVDQEGIIRKIDPSNTNDKVFIDAKIVNKTNIQYYLLDVEVKSLISYAEEHGQIAIKATIKQGETINHSILTVKPLKEAEGSRYLFIFNCFFENNIMLNPVFGKLHDCIAKSIEVLGFGLAFDETLELIFLKLKEIIKYDVVLMIFPEKEHFIIRASSQQNYDFNIPREIKISDSANLNKFIKFKKSIILTESLSSNNTARLLGIDQAKSIIITPLLFKESIFGLMILASKETNSYQLEDTLVLERFAAVSAYSVKNAELTGIMRAQLKILREVFLESSKELESLKASQKDQLDSEELRVRYIANMCGNIRAALKNIISNSESLKSETCGTFNNQQEEYLRNIDGNADQVLEMIDDICLLRGFNTYCAYSKECNSQSAR